MPRVKFDYVVSFSSEDPDNPASNLLEWEVSKKKWLCGKGESSCSVVLQLAKAIKIESISVGAYHAASVEVLVGLSENPNEAFEVLVPTCMLLSPAECRREAGAGRVRSFSGEALAAARTRRWDRVRLVCAQPYNRHAKYGLSFVHIHEPEGPLARALALDALPEEEEFSPGELFLQHSSQPLVSADAQIRQASMDAIKNNSDTATKLLKTPITKANPATCNPDKEKCPSRRKESLIYTDDDDQPHAKIDQVVQRHKEQKDKEMPRSSVKSKDNDKEKAKPTTDKEYSKEKKIVGLKKHSENKTTPSRGASTSDSSSHKRKRTEENRSSPRDVLAGVLFALSGYQNPERAELRAAALRLGARYRPAWGAACTHLVCAFAATPRLAAARGASWRGAAVGGAWLRACVAHGRRLPWRWFAVEPHERVAPPPGWEREPPASDDDTEIDTDDEIEKVLIQQKTKKRLKSPSPPDDTNEYTKTKRARTSENKDVHESYKDEGEGSVDADASHESDVCFVRDERLRAYIELSDHSSTDDERERRPRREDIHTDKVLPSFFEGLTFTIAEDLDEEYDRGLLARYIRAYGGIVVEESEMLDGGSGRAHYVVCAALGEEEEAVGECAGEGERRVRPEWVWRCHGERELVANC